MRRSVVICVLMMTLLLSACGGAEQGNAMQQVLTIRAWYLETTQYTANLSVTADYGQRVYTYGLEVRGTDGECVLTVTEPQELAGITARIANGESCLEYDGAVLETGNLSADGLTPLSAVPAMLDCVRTGFIDSCGLERLGDRDTLCVHYRDPERLAGEGREITIWFDSRSGALIQGEIFMDGYRVIRCDFEKFTIEKREGNGTKDQQNLG